MPTAFAMHIAREPALLGVQVLCGLQVGGFQSGFLCDAGEHPRADLFGIVERPDEAVRIIRVNQSPVRSTVCVALSFLPSNFLQSVKNSPALRAGPMTHATNST